ncbi:MAG: bifunctional hydroxymethylpyrimidine kinase/phosphomethylpyrimidine kinase [Acidimicrobiia bacterium]|nr:bifunctional hydroxymethylpyrimidine kinase/phosphomethylpyrimidine kinase [Acidimicrobiia bacterium]
MRSRPDVWSVGLVMVDDLYVEGQPRTSGLLGGGAVYACVGAAFAGARAGLVTRAGAGIHTETLAHLQQLGLVLAVKQVAAPSIHERVYVSASRETVFELEQGSGTYEGTCPRPSDFTSDLAPDQCVHIAPMPVPYQAEWVAAAAEAGSMITLDPHTDDSAADPDAYTDLIPACTAFLPSALESERLAGPDHEQAARDYVAAGARMAVVKLGHEGCVVATGTDVTFVPAQPVRGPVDTTGAGDAFCGAFAAAVAQGRSAVEAARVAVRAGAHMVQHAGAVAGFDGLPSKPVPRR